LATNQIGFPELPFDDFVRQPLLPNKLSRLGPGVAVGDVDGDGVEEIYQGSPSGSSGALFRRDAGGAYQFHTWDPFYEDRDSEDMSPLFLDVDADGDLDLYVASGGVECEPGAKVLKDRLYLNDGFGFFSGAPEGALPDLRDSGGVVAAADYDRDGDLDLFVGGRVVPGKYPTVPKSRLLENISGSFSDATERVAPDVLNTGMVTAALWSDVNRDGWVDLMVVHEWGPMKLFLNETEEAGLSSRTGWWNSIAGGDIDNDGDIDYVAGNFGLNTKYHASAEHPVLLYLADYERNGNLQIVEAEYEDSTLYPIRGRSCSTSAMPSLADRFKTYHDFARATLTDIYTPELLDQSLRLSVNTLESGVWINDGSGTFTFQPLPRLAQASPAFGLVIADFDGDRFSDLFVAQNFFSPQKETGHYDGGLSILLAGNGEGGFTPLPPRETDIVLPGDAKGAALTDLNGDLRPDLLVGINNAPLVAYENRSGNNADRRVINLKGKPGNAEGVGARVTVHYSDDRLRTTEVYAGSGYLSQSSRALFFGCPSGLEIVKIDVRWPDGTITSMKPDRGIRRIEISQSARMQ
jgi:hypothetical protein